MIIHIKFICRRPDKVDVREESVDDPGECGSQPPVKHPHFNHSIRDISSYITLSSADKTDDRKYRLIVDHFVPDATYKFPKACNGRSFQYRLLTRYPWLRYSEKADGGFCVPCVLFSHSCSFRSDPGVLVNTPLTDFKRAMEKLDYHSESICHKTAMVKMNSSK